MRLRIISIICICLSTLCSSETRTVVTQYCQYDYGGAVCKQFGEKDFMNFVSLLKDNVKHAYLIHPQMTTLSKQMLSSPTFKSLEKLRIKDAHFTSIEDESFKGADGLKHLDIQDNYAPWNISILTFIGAYHLTALKLINTRLKHIQPGSFVNTPSVLELDLSSNEVERLYPLTFLGLSKMTHCSLNNGALKVIDPGAFEGLDNMNNLTILWNNISYFQNGTFRGMPNLRFMYVVGHFLIRFNAAAFVGFNNLIFLEVSYSGLEMENNPDLFEIFIYNPGVTVAYGGFPILYLTSDSKHLLCNSKERNCTTKHIHIHK